MEGRAYRIRGRVQGVGFRWWSTRMAQRVGVTGTVRNEADGSVVIQAWGTADRLARLEELLRSGPAGARVEAVERLPAPTTPPPSDFSIAR